MEKLTPINRNATIDYQPTAKLSEVKALLFDVFGTVVDWRNSIIREGQALGRAKGIDIDWTAFVHEWRAGYPPAMDRVRSGEFPWTRIDDLHRMILNGLLKKFNIYGLSEDEIDHFNRAWHRLDPWPDAVAGLTRLKQRYTIATLSNGNVSLLVNMAKHADLPWDCILSAELASHYKPDPEAYLTAVDLLGLTPDQVMMVAAHNGDLKAASAVGLHTAFVLRPTEYGPNQHTDLKADPIADIAATDFNDLADRMTR